MNDHIVVLRDQPTIPEEMRPKLVEPGMDKTELKLPEKASVISRTSKIAVAADDDLLLREGVKQVDMTIGVGGNPTPPGPVVYAVRPPPSDPKLGGACITVSQPSRQTNVIGNGPAPQTKTAQEDTRFSRVSPESLRVPPAQIVTPQAAGISTVMATVKKTTVCLINPAMGKVRAKVDHVGVSDSLIMLAYKNDDNTTIVEPPICGADNPLLVEIGDQRYRCVYGGWSVEMLDHLWVVLLRTEE